MSGHVNDGNTSQGGASGSSGSSYPPTPWSFPNSFHPISVGTSIPNTSPTAAGRPLLGGMFAAPPPGAGRYGARAGNPYESSLARRRQMAGPGGNTSSTARDRRAGGDPERKRVVVACLRCRKRKIRCSGDDGTGNPCSNCKNANEPQCLFMRVQAGSLAEMRKKEQDKRIASSATVNTFTYDLDACRQYQSRGAASIGPAMSAAATPQSHSSYTPPPPSGGAFGGPTSNVMYNWAPSPATGGGYGGDGNSGHGSSGSNGGHGLGYGISYHALPYHGMPSPDASYMGDNDMMDRPSTTSSMADAGAFALQTMSQGRPTSSPGYHGHSHGPGPGPMSTTSTPRSLHPGPPPTVLGSSRGVPTSSVFSGSRAHPPQQSHQQYPSPATTPITSGVSPVWSGYEQQHQHQHQPSYGAASLATHSLERLPGLYSATPAAAGTAVDSGNSSPHGEDDVRSNSADSSSHQSQSQPHQQQHFGYEYGNNSRGGQAADGRGDEQHPGGVDMVGGNHTATAPGSYQ